MTNSKLELNSIILGGLTAAGLGTFLFQALGTLLLGVIGALGGYLFQRYLKPRLDKFLMKKNGEKAG
jgi:uncharacterized membrane protein